EGLLNKELHAILYSKKHTTLEACVSDAIDLRDNCEIFNEEDVPKDNQSKKTTSTKPAQVGKAVVAPLSAIEDMLKRMNDMMNNM
ncbi:hypothetical protein DD595_25490, partial [Enterobacter cloacae complex sp. 4DZ3-17B2]|uniref:hypothetical protein n=1 Tax=Enterobacter cloacae complex sp. 4DZ3-17B2 TaxID=2511990 RepID=UPI0010271E56